MSHACAKSQGGSLVLTVWRGCQSKSTSEALYFCFPNLNHQELGRFSDTPHYFEEVDHGYDCDDVRCLLYIGSPKLTPVCASIQVLPTTLSSGRQVKPVFQSPGREPLGLEASVALSLEVRMLRLFSM